MCFGSKQYGAPSVAATLNPVTGAKDMQALATGKERKNTNQVTDYLKPKIPDAPDIPPPPQAAKAPDTTPLKRRTVGGIAVPMGSTMLSGPNGIATSQLALGSQTLLGGG